jgi:putative spermidine/putrescine transport system ATP-binding protein
MTETNHALSLVGVAKRYGDLAAVADVSFDLPRGEFLTMLGPSGSGKTTTLRMIAGFIRPDEGQILVNGNDVVRTPPHKRHIGMVFQNYALFPHMTAERNVAFPLEMRGVGRAEAQRRAGSALELVGLDGHGTRRPAELSGGQQQRVALARAVVFEPDLLLMDEPLGALDRKLRGSMQIELMRIARETSATVISVTHDQEEALVMSDRIAIYNRGRIEQLGTAQDLYDRPASLFVADFIGDSNIFRGRAGTDGSPTALVVRPEHLTVVPAGEAGDASMRHRSGVVAQVVYLGAEWKYVVDLGGGETAQSRVRRSDDAEPIAPGTPVEVVWHDRHGVVLPDAAAPAAA